MLEIEISKALLLGFTVGLTGAVVPGPLLFATMEATLKKGWIAGPQVVMGHMLVEIVFCVFIFLGADSFLSSATVSVINLVGGFVLIVLGLLTIKDARTTTSSITISQNSSGLKLKSSPILLGVISSVSNPYLWIWWLTASSAIVLREYKLGIIVAMAYILGHWTADISWFTTISGSLCHGKALFSQKRHEYILYPCGVFMTVFGLYFLLNYNSSIL
jgi:threonine/homoserine/homoserine lactone efflux protein